MMASAKGSTSFQNLCWKCYKTYIFNVTLLQVEQILNKLEKLFQWLPPTQPMGPQKRPTLVGSLS